MDFSDYQTESGTTAIYPDNGLGTDKAITYVLLGLVGEAGELGNTYKKYFRGDITRNAVMAKLQLELGDVLWYLSQLATELGVNLEDIAEDNLGKLRDRQDRGMLQGSGDNR